jgi:uncharacterized protein YjdB
MTSFKRWFGAGAIVLVALALVACPSMVTVPKVIKEIPDMQFAAGATEAKTVQLGSYFEVDGDAQYEASSDQTSVATVSVSGAVLTVTPVRSGTANVEVTASKGGSDPVSQTFSVTVAAPEPDPVNQAPSVRTIPDISLQEGATKERTLSRYYTDPEGDSLTYTAESSADAVATVTDPDDGSMITITAVAAGTATITVTASDGENAAVAQTFDVEVAAVPDPPPPPPNFPPVVRTYIDDMSIQVGDAEMLTLSELFLDPEFLPLTYGASADPSDDSIVMVSEPDATSMITITAVAAGSATITLTATDTLGSGGVATQTFAVTVSETPVEPPDNNQPRQIQDIPDLTGLMFGGSQPVNLSMYFIDDDGDDVTYDADSSDESVVTTAVSGPVVTVTVVAPGMARIDVSATDPYNRAVRASFNVEVINQPPMVQADEPTRFGPFMPGDTQVVVLSRYFSDPEGESLTYTAMSDMTDYVTVSAVGADSTITITAVAAGTAMITITADDGTNDAVSHTLTVTVDPVPPVPPAPNNPPMLTGMAAPTVDLKLEDDPSETLDVSTHFSDADGDTLTYGAVSSDTAIATESVSGSMVTITAVAKGSATITVTASDGTNAAVAQTLLTVTVVATPPPANNAPMVKPGVTAPAVELVVEGGSKTLTLSMYFMDADADDTLMYTVTSSDPSVATAIELAGVLTIMPEGAGTATINVTASDGEAMSEALDISVTVRAAANLTPTVTGDGLLDLKMVVGGVETIDLADFFDDDSPRLFYKVTSDDSAEATIELAGGVNDAGTMVDDTSAPNGTNFASMLHIEGKGAGTATVTVVATDIGNKSVTDEFMVDVIAADENDAPTASGTIDGMDASGSRLKVGESETVIDDASISTHFADPNLKNGTSRRDGELLTFEVRYFEAGTSATDAADSDTEQLAAEDQTVSHSLSAMTWDGTSDSKFTLTLTGVKASTDVVVVALVATDEYGVSVAKVFNVRVNHPPKAEGAQATPKTLSGETAYRSLTWDETGNGRPVVLVAADAGYFTDADNDDLTCSYVQSPEADDDAPADISLAGTTLTITPDKQTGTMSVEVTCSDMDSGSASDTLQIGVVGKTFSVR